VGCDEKGLPGIGACIKVKDKELERFEILGKNDWKESWESAEA